MTIRVRHGVWLGMLGLLALSGCALMQSAATGTAPLHSAGQLQLPGGPHGHNIAIAYRTPGGYDEYHRRRRQGAITEAMYLEANGIQTALDFSVYRLHALTAKQWRFNRDPAQLTWHSKHLVPVGNGAVHAKAILARFTRSAPAPASAALRQCVAFVRAWDIPPDDPRRRPSRAYFGYHCAPAGQPLSRAAARRYVMHIHTAAQKLAPVRFGDHVPDEPDAVAKAHGNHSHYGAPGFPLRRVVDYVDSDHKMN
ncbi:hypothetical protein ACS8Y6_03020 [Salinisphaera sp. RV14]|uniref:hypothetical protein n=1 Tax=unclassified Salinisphaera TaxID=2649847 RepID=UPI003F86429F